MLRFSEAFDDAEKLLAAALELGLEGIVSKKRDQPYRSGKNVGWVKVKTAAWREANRGRWEMLRETVVNLARHIPLEEPSHQAHSWNTRRSSTMGGA